jgi:predicted kinase
MLVQRTADAFRATVSVMRSIDGSKGVSFHTFSLPEDLCVRLLIKNLGRQVPEDVVREKLETLDICVQGVLQLRSGRRDQEASKATTLNPRFIVSVARDLMW